MGMSLALQVNIERIEILTWWRKESGSYRLSWGRHNCLHKYFRVDPCAGWTRQHADTAIHRSSHTAKTVTKMRPLLERWKADFYCRCKVFTGHKLNLQCSLWGEENLYSYIFNLKINLMIYVNKKKKIQIFFLGEFLFRHTTEKIQKNQN